jgi:D-arginine dehydrogenase
MRVLVVGGGIAGVSAAAALAPHAEVTLVETEASLVYHTTGRSAALYFENYGERAIRPLSRASRPYLEQHPGDLVDAPLLSPRGGLTIAAEGAVERLDRIHAEGVATGTVVERLTTAQAIALSPVLRPEAVAAALWEPEAADIDVAGLHQSMVRAARRHRADILTRSELLGAARGASGWTARIGDATWQGDAIVDAAGAWGDVVAGRCGVDPVGLTPMRRTAFMVAGDERLAGTPMVIDAHHEWYFKPDGSQILCSLAEESPTEPGDPRAEELDVALAIERINEATTLDIRSVRSAWCGLRTFAPDRVMVVGPDPAARGFVWLVGQGGTGIQTAPAAGRLAAAAVLGEPVPDDLLAAGVDAGALGPGRLRAVDGS